MSLMSAEAARQKAQANREAKIKAVYEGAMKPFIEAIDKAIEEGENFASVHVPLTVSQDTKAMEVVFSELKAQKYSVFPNGNSRWLVKFTVAEEKQTPKQEEETLEFFTSEMITEEPTDPVFAPDEDLHNSELDEIDEDDYDYDDDDDIPF